MISSLLSITSSRRSPPPYVPAPKAQKYPEVPIRTTDWDISQGTKPAIKSTLVPFPFPGWTSHEGRSAHSSRNRGVEHRHHDHGRSFGSMTSPAFPVQDRSLDRIEVARGLICALIRVAQNQGDHFAVLSYGSNKYTEWPQSPAGNLNSWKMALSKDYDAAMQYFSQYQTDQYLEGFPPPIPCNDGTTHSFAVEGLVEKLRGTGIDSVVSFVITDDFYRASTLFDGFFSDDPKTMIPRDTILRRNDSTVYYFGIDNLGAASRCKGVAKELNKMIDEHYGRKISPAPAHFFPLDPANPNAAREMAELMIELAGRD